MTRRTHPTLVLPLVRLAADDVAAGPPVPAQRREPPSLACRACLGSRQCRACLGQGTVEIPRQIRRALCRSCDGTGRCPHCAVGATGDAA